MIDVKEAPLAAQSTFVARAAEHQATSEQSFAYWKARYDELLDKVSEAMADRDPRSVAELRIERAHVQLHLRDLWGPWNLREWERWDYGMCDDLRAAVLLAGQLGRQIGDDKLRDRLLAPYPALETVIAQRRWMFVEYGTGCA